LLSNRIRKAVIMLGVLYCALAHAEGEVRHAPSAGFYRIAVGDIEVTSLYDGAVDLQPTQLLTNTTTTEVRKLLDNAFQREPVATSVNAFLVKTGAKLLLIDTGGGNLFADECGQLLESLRAAGYTPEQVDEVYLTHMHRDHVGGLVTASGERAFPNATVRVESQEAAYWLDASRAQSVPAMKHHFEGAAASLKPYLQSGKLSTFDGDSALAQGVRAVVTRGHTEGHSLYVIESRGSKLVLWGDLVHVAAVQLPRPEITIRFDTDAEAAGRQRQRVFAEAAQGKYLVAGAHMPFPGIGYLRRDGTGYVFVPLDYASASKPGAVN